ncbi:isochorismate synthase [Candidatus Synechococcus calcipolaris G9]|uniref:isochorismate synthase n=1 Tax=Candidatus Synechococcus calcipolaris G9 TaxID=1497997 RepID=A0ABT6F0W5_9SYNE|nr:isochorismate synthase [Candidatus Synechococcus calcipolaris]MDG2991472.1 isochorismate synthase [Candidatus Synechococcus calcipolaris G9]
MPVSPSPTFDLSAQHQFRQQLVAGLTQARNQGCLFLSISRDLPPIDPLLALAGLSDCGMDPQADYFYLEQPGTGMAIAALGALRTYTAEGCQRFQDVRHFCQTTFAQIFCLDGGHPRIFCHFTFHDRPTGHQGTSASRAILPQWQIHQRDQQVQLTLNCDVLLEPGEIDRLCGQWQRIWEHLQTLPPTFDIESVMVPTISLPNLTVQHQGFVRGVHTALKVLQTGEMEKLVLACAADITAPRPFSWEATLQNLRHHYPNCYLFSVRCDGGSTFVGASPERLVSLEQGVLTADALAGSSPRGGDRHQDQALTTALYHSEKDRHEHQVIVQFLSHTLKNLGLLIPPPGEPQVLKLANIQHLQTLIRATPHPAVHLLDILAALHPTPAVAGYPRAIAYEWMRQLETFERGMYAAPLGWVDCNGEGEFIVGIRSALLQGTMARLYAGAGIVRGSDPEREWQEVLLKLQALVSAIA